MTPAAPQAAARDGDWWNCPRFIAAALFLAALPLLWPSIPPLIDLPSHMASYHIAASLDSSATLRQYFEFHWQLIGNLGVDLVAVPLAKALGAELATKLVVILIPVLTVAGMLWVAREIHGEIPPTAGFVLPLAYCYPLHFGFLNYCFSMALMLLAFALWLRTVPWRRHAWRVALFAVLALAVWIAHAVGWGLLALACLVSDVQRRVARGQAWPAALARAAATCAPLGTPLIVMACLPSHGSPGLVGWFVWPELAKWLVTLFRDRWLALDLADAAVFYAVLLVAVAARGGLRLRPALAVPALAMLAIFFVVPQGINDATFVNDRVAPYALALLALAIGTPGATGRQRRRWAAAAAAFFVARIAATTASLAIYGASWDANLQALDHIPPESRVVAFSRVPCVHDFANWRSPRLYHLPSLALIRKDAFVNTEWQVNGLQLLRVKYAAALPFDSDPSEMVTVGCDMDGTMRYPQSLERVPRAAFDYVWLLQIPAALWPHEPDLELVWSNGQSALYRISHDSRPLAD